MSLRFSIWHLSAELALWAPYHDLEGSMFVRYCAVVRWKWHQRGYYSLAF